jgi:Ca2+-binding RTX toxin-like protein
VLSPDLDMTITGTPGNDGIFFGSLSASYNGIDLPLYFIPTGARMIVNTLGGDDNVQIGEWHAATVDGGAGNDSISTSSADDSLIGGAGNDTLESNGGADRILGGDGDDLIDAGDDGTGGVENDFVDGGAGLDYVQHAENPGGNNLPYSFSAAGGVLTITGRSFDDRIESGNLAVDYDGMRFWFEQTGVTGVNRININGLGGDDYLSIFGGTPGKLDGGDGNDVLAAGTREVELLGGNGNDFLQGGPKIDTLNGGAGIDTSYGAAAGDVLISIEQQQTA